MKESTHTAPGGVATRTTRDLTKAAVSGWLGTAMEFMDFQLYSLAAAIVFNKIFFASIVILPLIVIGSGIAVWWKRR